MAEKQLALIWCKNYVTVTLCICDSISETVQDREIVTMEEYSRKSYVAYRMAPISVTLSDLESHFSCLKVVEISHLTYMSAVQMSVAHIISATHKCPVYLLTYIDKCSMYFEWLLKVINSHVQCKSDNISENVQDTPSIVQTTDRKWSVAYWISPFLMTLGDIQGHSPKANLFEWDFSYSCAAVNKIQLTWSVAPSLRDSWASCNLSQKFGVVWFHVHIRYVLSSVLLSVCNARAPYSAGWNFRQYFYANLYLGHPLNIHEEFYRYRSSQGNPSVGGGLNARGVAKYSDFGPIAGYISETVQDRR